MMSGADQGDYAVAGKCESRGRRWQNLNSSSSPSRIDGEIEVVKALTTLCSQHSVGEVEEDGVHPQDWVRTSA